jgi:hypothetical protein
MGRRPWSWGRAWGGRKVGENCPGNPSHEFYIGRQSGGKSGGTGPFAGRSGGPLGHSGKLAELVF